MVEQAPRRSRRNGHITRYGPSSDWPTSWTWTIPDGSSAGPSGPPGTGARRSSDLRVVRRSSLTAKMRQADARRDRPRSHAPDADLLRRYLLARIRPRLKLRSSGAAAAVYSPLGIESIRFGWQSGRPEKLFANACGAACSQAGTGPAGDASFCACCSAPAAPPGARLGARESSCPIACGASTCERGRTRNLAAAVGSMPGRRHVGPGPTPRVAISATVGARRGKSDRRGCGAFAASRAFRPRIEPGHTAAERAVWWLSERESCACANPRFAQALSAQSGAPVVEPQSGAEPRFFVWLVAGPLVARVGSARRVDVPSPLVRLASWGRMTIAIDGRRNSPRWSRAAPRRPPASVLRLRR